MFAYCMDDAPMYNEDGSEWYPVDDGDDSRWHPDDSWQPYLTMVHGVPTRERKREWGLDIVIFCVGLVLGFLVAYCAYSV